MSGVRRLGRRTLGLRGLSLRNNDLMSLMSKCQFPPPGRFWIYLTDLHEPIENSLRVAVAEAITVIPKEKISGPASLRAPIIITPDSRRFELVWESYVGYSVRDEGFAQSEKDRPSIVSVFLERTSSAYLRFLEETTFATSVIQKPMRHWEINCLNHCVDVVSFSEPIIREISNSETNSIVAKPD
jgi:hypothetical protein